MKFYYKWPISYQNNQNNQALFVNKQNKQTVSTSDQTLDIGIATVVFYFITLFYIYVSSVIKNKNITSISVFLKKILENLKSGTILNLDTLSSSFENSEKIGTTIGLIIFLAMLQGLFSFQNIYINDMKRAPIIAFNYIIVLCLLLFMFIFPYEKKKTSLSHSFLAFCILSSIIINSFLITNLYENYFDKSSIEPLVNISYALVGVAIFAGLAMLCNIFLPIYLLKYVHGCVAYAEMACLVLFGIFIILFIQFPPLPNEQQLSCVILPNSGSS